MEKNLIMENKLTQDTIKELLKYDPESGIFFWLKTNSRRIKIGSMVNKKFKRIKL